MTRGQQFRELLRRGNLTIAPGAYEVMFPSLAHTDADIEATVIAAQATAETIVAAAC